MPCFQRAVPRTFAGFSFFYSLGLFDAICFPSFTFPLFFFFFFLVLSCTTSQRQRLRHPQC